MELDDTMRTCLIDSNNEYPDYDYPDTVIAAFRQYVSIVGGPVEFVDEVEAEEYFERCVLFLVDCNLWNLLEKGVMEIEGMDPDGELTYRITAEF